MNNYKISALTFSFIIICLIDTNLLSTIFPFLISKTKYSFIYSLILVFIIGLLFLLLFLKVFSTLPDKNIIEKVNIVLPKPFSKIINLLLSLLVLLIVIITFFKFSTFVSSEYLTNTPTFMICILLSIPIFIAMFKDIDLAGRCATLIVLTTMILFFFSRISLSTTIKIENLKPILFDDSVFLNSLITSVLHLSPLFAALIIPKNNIINNRKIWIYLLVTYILSFLMIAIIVITIIGILGVELSSLYTYPSYVVLKNLNVLNFIKNIENFSVLFWIMFMSYMCAFGLFYIKTYIITDYNIKKQKTLNMLMSIIFLSVLLIIYLILPYENNLNNHILFSVYIPCIIYALFMFTSSFLFIFRSFR